MHMNIINSVNVLIELTNTLTELDSNMFMFKMSLYNVIN